MSRFLRLVMKSRKVGMLALRVCLKWEAVLFGRGASVALEWVWHYNEVVLVGWLVIFLLHHGTNGQFCPILWWWCVFISANVQSIRHKTERKQSKNEKVRVTAGCWFHLNKWSECSYLTRERTSILNLFYITRKTVPENYPPCEAQHLILNYHCYYVYSTLDWRSC